MNTALFLDSKALLEREHAFRNLSGANEALETLVDGSKVESDNEGRITYVEYASGVRVKRFTAYCLVKSADQSLWFGDKTGNWHPMD